MPYRYHGRAQVSTSNPQAWAVCDKCGILYNRRALSWEIEWRGTVLGKTGALCCERCLDVNNEQLRATSLPIDPVPIHNPSIEPYDADEYQRTRITMDGRIRSVLPENIPFHIRVTVD